MGIITFSERFSIIENTPLFHELGVLPTSPAIVPTLSFTSVNIVVRLSMTHPLQYFLYKFSYLVENRSHDLGKQACKLRNYRLCHNYNTATRHELLDPL